MLCDVFQAGPRRYGAAQSWIVDGIQGAIVRRRAEPLVSQRLHRNSSSIAASGR